MARAKKGKISVWNWMGTLFLCAIPGVNLIATICFLIFAKSPSKKSFAWAMLLWMVILLAATTAALLLMRCPVPAVSVTAFIGVAVSLGWAVIRK